MCAGCKTEAQLASLVGTVDARSCYARKACRGRARSSERRRVGDEDEKLTCDNRREAETRNTDTRIWISGLEAVQRKVGIKTVYDLSATPFFLAWFRLLRRNAVSEGRVRSLAVRHLRCPRTIMAKSSLRKVTRIQTNVATTRRKNGANSTRRVNSPSVLCENSLSQDVVVCGLAPNK